MRIFLTGGTGYIGSAVLDALVRGGHHVVALVRNRERAAYVQSRGGHAVVGDLAQPASFADAAASADGVVHAAIEYSPRQAALDGAALDVLLKPGRTPGRFVIYTSGIWLIGPSPTPAEETTPINPIEHAAWRPPQEARVLAAADCGLRPIVVRPGIVYGGARGIVGDLLKDASNGLVRIIGAGDNHWPLVYDRDLGDLYLRLANAADASGIYHANDEGDETVNDIVAAITAHVPIRPSIRHVPIAEARKKMGTYAEALALDQRLRSPRARQLGWNPTLHSVSGNVSRLLEEWRRGREAA